MIRRTASSSRQRALLHAAVLFSIAGAVASCSSTNEGSEWYNSSVAKHVWGDFNKTANVVEHHDEETAKLLPVGQYLTTAVAACGACHGEKPGDPNSPLSGGRLMEDRFGSVFAANITSDAATGIGAWNLPELTRAIRASIDKNGKPLSIDVHEAYRWMSDRDAKAIALYLLSTKPVSKEVERRQLGGFERNRWGLFPQHRETMGYVPAIPKSVSEQWGKYVTMNVAQCQLCHSAPGGPGFGGYRYSGSIWGLFTALGRLLSPASWNEEHYDEDIAAYLSAEGKKEYQRRVAEERGEPVEAVEDVERKNAEKIQEIYQEALEEGNFPVLGPDIRGNSDTGLAAWTEDDIVKYLSSGESKNGEIREGRFCPWPFYRRMTDDDKRSIAKFLKAL